MDTAVQILGLTLMVLALCLLVVSVAGMFGLVPPPPWWTDASRSPDDRS